MLKKIKQILKKNKVSEGSSENNSIHGEITELSQSLLDTIYVDNIIYAEYAEAGAMGYAGQAIIYVFNEDLVCYRTNVFDNEDLYCQVQDLLSSHSNDRQEHAITNTSLLDYYYGGVGNHVYINKNNTLEIAEEHFVYTNGSCSHLIYSSVLGVFYSVVGAIQNKGKE